jgi:hypothetical protein
MHVRWLMQDIKPQHTKDVLPLSVRANKGIVEMEEVSDWIHSLVPLVSQSKVHCMRTSVGVDAASSTNVLLTRGFQSYGDSEP